jgi:hypothetical protein
MKFLALSLVVLVGCCSSPPKKIDCVKDDGPAYCRAKEMPGHNKL